MFSKGQYGKSTGYGCGTWIQSEEYCKTPNGKVRRGYALYNGQLRAFRASIPDTYFTIPAKCAGLEGYLSVDGETGALVFRAYAKVQA